MAFRRGQGGEAQAYLAERGMLGRQGASQAIREANRGQRFEAAGLAFNRQMLRGHAATPEHPGRQSALERGTLPIGRSELARVARLPKQVESLPNGVLRAMGIRRKAVGERVIRAYEQRQGPEGRTTGRVRIFARTADGEVITLGGKAGYSASYLRERLAEAGSWRNLLGELLASAPGYESGAGEDVANLDMDTVELVNA